MWIHFFENARKIILKELLGWKGEGGRGGGGGGAHNSTSEAASLAQLMKAHAKAA